jgi:hypothetical protein
MLQARQPQFPSQPSASDAAIEALARQAYDACHPDDTFDDLKRRAGFTREAAGLLRPGTRAARSGGLGPVGSTSPNQAFGEGDALAA